MSLLQERIKSRRLALGLTLAEVADRIGVKDATVQRYESGEIKNIKHDTIYALSVVLKCNPAYLMGWTDEVSNASTVKQMRHIKKVQDIVDETQKLNGEQLEDVKKYIAFLASQDKLPKD